MKEINQPKICLIKVFLGSLESAEFVLIEHSGSGLSHFYTRSLLSFVCCICMDAKEANQTPTQKQPRLLKLE